MQIQDWTTVKKIQDWISVKSLYISEATCIHRRFRNVIDSAHVVGIGILFSTPVAQESYMVIKI